MARVRSWWKALMVLALVIPMAAYVVGSLATSGTGEPADRGPVILQDPPSLSDTRGPRLGDDDRVDDAAPREDHSARVVTVTPVPVDDDDATGTDEGLTGARDDQAGPGEGRDDDTTDDDTTDRDDDGGGDDDDDRDDEDAD